MYLDIYIVINKFKQNYSGILHIKENFTVYVKRKIGHKNNFDIEL